jgi:ketosteroid isomerase-like protein
MRSFLAITFTHEGKAAKHSGHILTIWQKESDGRWVIKRDANFVKPESNS